MLLEVNNLTIKYGSTKVINNVSFNLHSGEILGIIGKNGSGKTSLCKAVAGVLDDAEITGKVILNGSDNKDLSIAERCQNIGIIFQEPDTQLFSPTVIDELAFAVENLCIEREEIKNRITLALNLCSIMHLKERDTNSLSGGEKQLVAIASVLTMQPKIIVADEITSRVDTENKGKVFEILSTFAKNQGGVIFVSHNDNDLEICNRIMEL